MEKPYICVDCGKEFTEKEYSKLKESEGEFHNMTWIQKDCDNYDLCGAVVLKTTLEKATKKMSVYSKYYGLSKNERS